jgi:hypothetical protein
VHDLLHVHPAEHCTAADSRSATQGTCGRPPALLIHPLHTQQATFHQVLVCCGCCGCCCRHGHNEHNLQRERCLGVQGAVRHEHGGECAPALFFECSTQPVQGQRAYSKQQPRSLWQWQCNTELRAELNAKQACRFTAWLTLPLCLLLLLHAAVAACCCPGCQLPGKWSMRGRLRLRQAAAAAGESWPLSPDRCCCYIITMLHVLWTKEWQLLGTLQALGERLNYSTWHFCHH